MGYIEDSLVKGEQVVMRAKPHWAFFFSPMILLVVLWFLFGAMFKDATIGPLRNQTIL